MSGLEWTGANFSAIPDGTRATPVPGPGDLGLDSLDGAAGRPTAFLQSLGDEIVAFRGAVRGAAGQRDLDVLCLHSEGEDLARYWRASPTGRR